MSDAPSPSPVVPSEWSLDVAKRCIAAFNSAEAATFSALLAPDSVEVDETIGFRVQGAARISGAWSALRELFPSSRLELVGVIREGPGMVLFTCGCRSSERADSQLGHGLGGELVANLDAMRWTVQYGKVILIEHVRSQRYASNV